MFQPRKLSGLVIFFETDFLILSRRQNAGGHDDPAKRGPAGGGGFQMPIRLFRPARRDCLLTGPAENTPARDGIEAPKAFGAELRRKPAATGFSNVEARPVPRTQINLTDCSVARDDNAEATLECVAFDGVCPNLLIVLHETDSKIFSLDDRSRSPRGVGLVASPSGAPRFTPQGERRCVAGDFRSPDFFNARVPPRRDWHRQFIYGSGHRVAARAIPRRGSPRGVKAGATPEQATRPTPRGEGEHRPVRRAKHPDVHCATRPIRHVQREHTMQVIRPWRSAP